MQNILNGMDDEIDNFSDENSAGNENNSIDSIEDMLEGL
jgi:hypothetical protein